MSRDRVKKKTSKTKPLDQIVTATSSSNEFRNWIKFLEPKSSVELIAHAKKIEEINKWFTEVQQESDNKILLIIGPPGCTKLTTIKILSKEFNFDVTEWTSKLEIDRDLLADDDDHSFHNYQKQSDAFKNFLFKASRYNSIFSSNDRLLVVKDFPNIFLRKGNEDIFWNILRKYKVTGSSPLIFILTETNCKSLNIEHNLFPEVIRSQLLIDVINMNPIPVTVVKKALKAICACMKENIPNFEEPSHTTIDEIVMQSQGDIRNAIMNLQMATKHGTVDPNIPAKPTRKTSKRKKKDEETSVKAAVGEKSKAVGRDEVLGIFRGVGRALYPKRNENDPKKLLNSPESVADNFYSQPGNYIELLHSNYLKTFTSINGVHEFTNVMSLSDIFQTEYRNAEKLHTLNLNMVIRGAMVCNDEPAKGFRPITAYASKKFMSVEEKSLKNYLTQSPEYNSGHKISMRDYFLDYTSIAKHIKST